MLYIGQNGGDARHGRRARNKKDEAMKNKGAIKLHGKVAEFVREAAAIRGVDESRQLRAYLWPAFVMWKRGHRKGVK